MLVLDECEGARAHLLIGWTTALRTVSICSTAAIACHVERRNRERDRQGQVREQWMRQRGKEYVLCLQTGAHVHIMQPHLHVSSLSLCSHRRVTRDAHAWFRSRISLFSLCSSGDPPLRVCAGPPKISDDDSLAMHTLPHAHSAIACMQLNPISPCGPSSLWPSRTHNVQPLT
jgi:hypothetical protein